MSADRWRGRSGECFAFSQGALDDVRALIEEHGWAALTMDGIATALGVSRMTLHRRGVRRDDVLRALADLLEDEYRRALWPALTAAGTGRERLEAGLRGLCAVTERNLSLMAALDATARDAVLHEPGAEALTRRVFTEPLASMLRDGAADGTLAPDDVEETATVLFDLVAWTYRHLRLAHRWSARRATGAVVRRAIRSVSADR
jgi:AcrR family transcriptional regulator